MLCVCVIALVRARERLWVCEDPQYRPATRVSCVANRPSAEQLALMSILNRGGASVVYVRNDACIRWPSGPCRTDTNLFRILTVVHVRLLCRSPSSTSSGRSVRHECSAALGEGHPALVLGGPRRSHHVNFRHSGGYCFPACKQGRLNW